MDDPITDIPNILPIILGSSRRDQKNYVENITRYYHENIEYKSFIGYVPSNRKSRESLMDIDRVCRGFIWNDKSRINEIWYNEETCKAIIEVTQTARRGIFFWVEQRSRFLIKLELAFGNDGKYVIRRQEDLMQPEEFFGLIVPIMVPTIIRLQKILFYAIFIVIGFCINFLPL